MTLRRVLNVADDGRLEGLHVIGFQGAVDPASTPAQRAPVLVDDEHRLSRIVELQLGRAVVESVEPPLPAEGPLPGVATRFARRFPAMLEGVVAIAGRSERPLVHKIDVDRLDLPLRVAGFLRWLRDDDPFPDDAPYDRSGAGLWACYLTVSERYALWKALHAEVYRSLRAAVRADDPARMIAAAFWLSRVVVDAESDLFKAALALRRAGSPHWKFMLREGLRLKDEAAWEKGLAEAAYAFDGRPETLPEAPRRHSARELVRHGAANR